MISYKYYAIDRFTRIFYHRDEDRDKSEHLKSSSSEESVRKRRPSGNISINSQLSICTNNSNTLSNITCGSDYTGSTISTTTQGVGSITGSGSTIGGSAMSASPSHPQYQTIQQMQQPTQQPPPINNQVTHQPPLPSAHPLIGEKLTADLKDPDYIHYDTVDLKGSTYSYHDEPHSFETSGEFLEDMTHFTFEVLETTV